jgi:hypothetical protein
MLQICDARVIGGRFWLKFWDLQIQARVMSENAAVFGIILGAKSA